MATARQTLTAITTALLLCAGQPVSAKTQESFSNRFIDRSEEGWFWYVEPEEPEEPELISPPEPVAAQPVEKTPEAEAPKGPAVLSAAWLRENLPKYLDNALDNPSIENVETYLYLQRFSMDRAEQFANTAEMAVTGNPMLDEMTRRPTATYGTQKVDIVAGQQHDLAVANLAEQAGVFFFYDPEDEYSMAMAPLVTHLKQSGFSVIAISETGAPIPGHDSDFTYRKDEGHAKQLNVINYPAVFLADPGGNFAPIGQGLMSLPDMTQRMLIAAKREGWISEDDYNKTRPLTNADNLAEMLASYPAAPDGLDGMQAIADQENGNFVSPEQLIQFIKAKTQSTMRQEIQE